MKVFRIGVFAVLIALAFFTNPDIARAQNSRNCAWPIEISPEGFGNFVLPDNVARYWAMPFEKEYQTMTIKGAYPNARYFSYVTYSGEAPVDVAGDLYDAQIAPDPGSVNPFVQPQARTIHRPANGTYTVVISRSGQTSGNTIKVSSDFAWVVLRLYVPNADPNLGGQNLMGGVPLPTITLTGQSGGSQPLEPCSPVNKLPDLSAFLQVLFPPGFDLIGDEGTPSSDRLWFAPPANPPIRLFPNPHNKYIAMMPGNYQPGRLIVIHGKAPGFPNTFNGSPVWVPARGFRTVDMRYWSACHNDFALPFSAVNCTADLTTDVKGGSYAIVISDDLLRPGWLRRNINWLPWGDEQYPKLVLFRNMLPATGFPYSIQNAVAAGCTFDFMLPHIPDRAAVDKAGQCAQHVMGDYYPVAAWCDKSTFVRGGWRACLKEQ
jgi:hypothetical protein